MTRANGDRAGRHSALWSLPFDIRDVTWLFVRCAVPGGRDSVLFYFLPSLCYLEQYRENDRQTNIYRTSLTVSPRAPRSGDIVAVLSNGHLLCGPAIPQAGIYLKETKTRVKSKGPGREYVSQRHPDNPNGTRPTRPWAGTRISLCTPLKWHSPRPRGTKRRPRETQCAWTSAAVCEKARRSDDGRCRVVSPGCEERTGRILGDGNRGGRSAGAPAWTGGPGGISGWRRCSLSNSGGHTNGNTSQNLSNGSLRGHLRILRRVAYTSI